MFLQKILVLFLLINGLTKLYFKETASQPISFPSINKENFETFKKNYGKFYDSDPNQLSLITYDLVGLVYYLLVKE